MSNPGTANLVAWWSLDEASGNRADSHGGNTLTDNATVTSAAGVVGNAATMLDANGEYLSIADNAALSFGDEALTLACWVKANTGITQGPVMAKWQTAGQREYVMYATASTFRFLVSNNGSSNSLTASWGSSYSVNTWYFVVARHDPTANTLSISVNAGTPVSVAHSTGLFNGTSQFALGRAALLFGGTEWDGAIDEASVWRRVLTDAEVTWLYNAGAGRAYSALAAGLLPSMLQHAAMGWR